jgi:hypothetical protein
VTLTADEIVASYRACLNRYEWRQVGFVPTAHLDDEDRRRVEAAKEASMHVIQTLRAAQGLEPADFKRFEDEPKVQRRLVRPPREDVIAPWEPGHED